MSKHAKPAAVRLPQWRFGQRLAIAIIAAAAVTFVGMLSGAFGPTLANAATTIANGSVTTAKLAPNAVHNPQVADGTLTYKDLGPALKAKVDQIGTGGAAATFEVRSDGHLWQVTPTEKDLGQVVGKDGTNGQDAPQPVAVTAQTQMINRGDGGHFGTWATDNMLRTLAVQRHGQVDVSHCGGSEADNCWFYTATISDSGSFTTMDGAKSPRQGLDINGTVSGTVTGNGRFEFYSTDGAPNAGAVPPTEDGNVHGSASWPALAFADGSVFNVTEHKYAYVYTATALCETWTETSGNNDGQASDAGDITGVNHC